VNFSTITALVNRVVQKVFITTLFEFGVSVIGMSVRVVATARSLSSTCWIRKTLLRWVKSIGVKIRVIIFVGIIENKREQRYNKIKVATAYVRSTVVRIVTYRAVCYEVRTNLNARVTLRTRVASVWVRVIFTIPSSASKAELKISTHVIDPIDWTTLSFQKILTKITPATIVPNWVY